MTHNDATLTQNRAAHPNNSTWVEANAGSGKTRVLTDRVARLLLEGVQPQHILCLTYTKAAASEMQNRLFKRLGEWAMKNSDELTLSLLELGVEHDIDTAFLARSRRLFAQAIEAPGGLKIQTIHSFCSGLLRRFPLEAKVSPQFTEIEERTATMLRRDIVDDMAVGDHKPLVDGLAHFYTGEDFLSLTSEILRHRDRLTSETAPDPFAELGIDASLTPEKITGNVLLGSENALLDRLIPLLLDSSSADQKAGHRLKAADLGKPSGVAELESLLLFGKTAQAGPFSAKIDAFPTKPVRLAHPDLIDELNALMLRVETGRRQRIALTAARKTQALQRFAAQFIRLYDSRKQALGYLDFDDLIRRARQLLTDPAVAQWVLFRLDGGIDHILVDEAQDTSPIQWQVIELLAQEFTSGVGARADVVRTLFVVGDKKQSIYSFQGADPDAFDQMRAEFSHRLSSIDSRLHEVPMQFSFRSSPAILNMVDYTFHEGHADAIGQPSHHESFKMKMPGRVDLWPVVAPVDEEDDSDWTKPVDQPGQRNHKVILATQIADEIQRLLDNKETIPAEIGNSGVFHRRPIQPGDFLILVRGRIGGMFHQIIQACKERNLPIAGADRLKVGGELAVKDVAALLSFLALQDDDLSLAIALRSPLFGWSEQDLFALAHGRGKRPLWQVLRDQTEKHGETLDILHDLRDQTDFLRPFELIERVLTRHGGRANLLSRLGPEAEDGIDALLAQALAYESTSTPSLTGFLVWMQENELEIKRQVTNDGNLIRVMTVHGAKGLEAPIVILPETMPPRNSVRDELLAADGGVYWKTRAEELPETLVGLRDAALDKQQREHLRLLYVAMTRAEKWLIVAGAGHTKGESKGWYDVVSEGMSHAGGEPTVFPTGEGFRYALGDWSDLPLVETAERSSSDVTLPAWIAQNAPTVAGRKQTLSPSDLGGAKALPSDLGMDEETAKTFGSVLHVLLEHFPKFPQADWPTVAKILIAQSQLSLPEGLSQTAIDEAISNLSHPDLAAIFAPNTLAEVSISADLGDERIHGTIDRLLVTGTTVTAVDFKSNRAVPETPEETPVGLLRQMGAYAHALAQIYPDKVIETEILWTAKGIRMQIPEDLAAKALGNRDAP